MNRRLGGLRVRVVLALLAAPLPVFAAAPTFQAQAPLDVGADWEGYNKTLEGQRYSTLGQINASNAASLVEVCRVRLAPRGSLQSGLVVIDDSMYVTTPTETFSLDPVTCRIKWT